jgi:hypothetical protein
VDDARDSIERFRKKERDLILTFYL